MRTVYRLESEGVPAAWRVASERYGRVMPSTDPERYLATLRALGPGVSACVTTLGDAEGVLVGREETRRHRVVLGYLRFPFLRLKCVDVVYDGVIAGSDPETASAVGRTVMSLLAGGVDVIRFNHLRRDSEVAAELRRLGAIEDPVQLHWVLPLVPGSFEKTMEHRTGKHRGNLRRMDKKLWEHFGGDAKVQGYSRPEDIEEFITTAQEITRASYHGALGAGVLDNRLWRELLQVEAGAGRWRAFILFGGGKAIAYETGLVYGDTFHLEATSFRPEFRQLGAGTVLLMRVIAEVCTLGARRFDFGFGDAEYKRSNATENWEEASVRLYGSGLKARCCGLVDRINVRLMESVLVKSLGGRVKKVWRSVLTRAGKQG